MSDVFDAFERMVPRMIEQLRQDFPDLSRPGQEVIDAAKRAQEADIDADYQVSDATAGTILDGDGKITRTATWTYGTEAALRRIADLDALFEYATAELARLKPYVANGSATQTMFYRAVMLSKALGKPPLHDQSFEKLDVDQSVLDILATKDAEIDRLRAELATATEANHKFAKEYTADGERVKELEAKLAAMKVDFLKRNKEAYDKYDKQNIELRRRRERIEALEAEAAEKQRHYEANMEASRVRCDEMEKEIAACRDIARRGTTANRMGNAAKQVLVLWQENVVLSAKMQALEQQVANRDKLIQAAADRQIADELLAEANATEEVVPFGPTAYEEAELPEGGSLADATRRKFPSFEEARRSTEVIVGAETGPDGSISGWVARPLADGEQPQPGEEVIALDVAKDKAAKYRAEERRRMLEVLGLTEVDLICIRMLTSVRIEKGQIINPAAESDEINRAIIEARAKSGLEQATEQPVDEWLKEQLATPIGEQWVVRYPAAIGEIKDGYLCEPGDGIRPELSRARRFGDHTEATEAAKYFTSHDKRGHCECHGPAEVVKLSEILAPGT